MVGEKIQFKQRSPISQLLLSLFIPFYYLYWLASSHKQINQLAGKGEKGTPPIRMSVWWPISLVIAGIVLLVGAIVVAVVGDVDTENYAASPLPVASASVVAHVEGDLLPPAPDFYQVAVDDDSPGHDDDDSSPVYYTSGTDSEAVDDTPSTAATAGFLGLYFLCIMVLIAFQIVQFFYLLQHTDGLIRLAGSEQDKTSLIVMSAIGCFVFWPLVLAVIHKSQTIVNQAIGKSDQSSA